MKGEEIMNAKLIEIAYEALQIATDHAYSTGEKVITAKAKLDADIALAYGEGIVEGKNANERDGWVIAHFAPEKNELEKFQAAERAAKYELEKARIRVEETRALLRLMELTH